MAQAVAGSGEDLIPTVILGEYNKPDMLALVRLPDLLKILAAALGNPAPQFWLERERMILTSLKIMEELRDIR
jgi:hypothetical protein